MNPADKAVSHILRRTHSDPVFAWFMLGTESLQLLCEAHAARTGKIVEKLRWPETRDPRAELQARVEHLEKCLSNLDPSGEISAAKGLVDEGPEIGPQCLHEYEVIARILDLLGQHASDPRRCVREIAALFDSTEIPIQLLAS